MTLLRFHTFIYIGISFLCIVKLLFVSKFLQNSSNLEQAASLDEEKKLNFKHLANDTVRPTPQKI